MLFYLFIFLLSYLMYSITEKLPILVRVIFSTLPLLIIATFRDTTVGFDVELYLVKLWNSCQTMNYDIAKHNNDLIDIGYFVFTYIVSLLGRDINILFFLEHFIVLTILVIISSHLKQSQGRYFFLIFFVICGKI